MVLHCIDSKSALTDIQIISEFDTKFIRHTIELFLIDIKDCPFGFQRKVIWVQVHLLMSNTIQSGNQGKSNI